MTRQDPSASRQLSRELYRLVVLLAVFTAAFVLTLAFVPLKASWTDWRSAHESYNRQAEAAGRRPIEMGIQQIWRPEIGLTDRCTSCHLGMGPAPALEGGDTLAGPHPDAYHDVGRMGCTICHRGQGRATSTEAAHGYGEHSEDPMLAKEHLQASCGPCHAESMRVPQLKLSQRGAELFAASDCGRCHSPLGTMRDRQTSFAGIGLRAFERNWQPLHTESNLVRAGYRSGSTVAPQSLDEVGALNAYLDSLVGAPRLMRGLQVSRELGCNGCHRIWGAGSDQGPAITDAASTPATRRDFTNVAKPHTSVSWHRAHLNNASLVSPGSKMPSYSLEPEDEEALLTFIMALRHYELPLDELPPDTVVARITKRRSSAEDGEALFRQFCVGCHADGVDERIVPPNKAVPHITHPSVLSLASAGYLRYSIAHGREGREMPDWGQLETGLRPQEIEAITRYLLDLMPEPPPFAAVQAAMASADSLTGRKLFNADCARCHGLDAVGTLLAPTLARPELQAVATDRLLYDVITGGRPSAGMPRMPDYSAQFLANLIAWLRTASPAVTTEARTIRRRATKLLGVDDVDEYVSDGDPGEGEGLYRTRCARCHEGLQKPGIGPSLKSPEFLAQVPDGFIVATALLDGGYCQLESAAGAGERTLTRSDLDQVVLYLRTRPPAEPQRPARASLPGRAEAGGRLFTLHCSGCHGVDGGGDKAPALNNQALLASATDGFLMATIARGRPGTAMPSWGPGGGAQPPLEPQQIRDLVAFLRSWQQPIETADAAPTNPVMGANAP